MTWRTISSILKRFKNKIKLPNSFSRKNSDNTYTEPLNIANKFNEYFVNVGQQLASKLPNNSEVSFENYLNGNYVESMFAEPITEYEMKMEVDNLKTTKAEGMMK